MKAAPKCHQSTTSEKRIGSRDIKSTEQDMKIRNRITPVELLASYAMLTESLVERDKHPIIVSRRRRRRHLSQKIRERRAALGASLQPRD